MTLTLLPKEQVDAIRSIGDAANVFIALFLIDRHYPGRSTRPDELARLLGKDKRVVEKRLDSLCGSDRVIFDGRGYVLLEGGRALLLASTPELPAQVMEKIAQIDGDDFDQALALSLAQAQALSPETPIVEKAHQVQAHQIIDVMPTPEVEDSPEENAHTARALVVEEVNTLILKEDLSTTTYLEAQAARELTIPQVFGKSHLLFGESVLVRRDVSSEYVISVFAHVYAQIESADLKKPARVAFSMMRDGKQPREDFIQDPWSHLPADYLEALGVVRYRCNECPSLAPFTKAAELDAHLQAVHPALVAPEVEIEDEQEEIDIDESVNEPCPNVRMTPAQAWQSVLGQLQMEMHRAPFETWVRDTQAVRFDGMTLSIGAHNSYTAQWLESRLQITVERLLVGIMNQSVSVRFVVVEH